MVVIWIFPVARQILYLSLWEEEEEEESAYIEAVVRMVWYGMVWCGVVWCGVASNK